MAGFDTRNALNIAIRALTDSAIKRAAGGWIPPKERERQQKEAMRAEEKQARQAEKQQKEAARAHEKQQKLLSKQFPTQYMPHVGRQVMNTGGTPEDLIGYHGSGKQFESFDPSLAGSATGSEYGEAAGYISEQEPVAQEYKQRAEKRMGMLYQGKPVREMRNDGLDLVRAELVDRINDGFEPQEALQDRVNHWLYFAKDFRERAEKDPENREKHLQEAQKFEDRANLFAALDPNEFSRHKGHMYQVKVLAHPDHFLDWNKPFSEQSDHVRERLTPVVEQIDKLYNEPRRRRGEMISKYDQPQNMTGEKIYRYLQKHSNGDWTKPANPLKSNPDDHKYSTKFLKDLGIRGVSYLDRVWNPANPPRNYAVYNPEDLEILKRYASGGSVHVNNTSRPKFALGGTNGTDETVASGFGQTPAEEGKLQVAGGLGGSDGNVPAPNQTPAEEALEGLPSKVKIPVTGETLMVGPDPRIRQIARDYMAEAGLSYSPPKKYAKVDPERAGRIAQAFEDMPHDPDHPLVKASYDALINETMAQYQAAKKAGFKAEFWDPETQEDPYAASPRMATEDIRNNHHMYVFPTRFGYGSGEPITEEEIRQNPMLKDSGETWNGQPVTVNDIFRAVHDYYGHAKEGVGFRHDGEENAWRAHASMFSPLARMAMTTETRGQNSWLNFGPHGEKNKSARTEDTVFADQKIGVLPPWVAHEGAEDFVRADDVDAIKKLYDQHFGDREKRADGGSVRDEFAVGGNPGDLAGGGFGTGNIGGGSSISSSGSMADARAADRASVSGYSADSGGGSSWSGGGGRDSSPSIGRSIDGGQDFGFDRADRMSPMGLGIQGGVLLGGVTPSGYGRSQSQQSMLQSMGIEGPADTSGLPTALRPGGNIGAALTKEALTPDLSTANSPLASGIESYDQNAINALYDRMREEQQAARDAAYQRSVIGPVTKEINVPNAGDLYGATNAPLTVNQQPSGMLGQPEFGTTKFGEAPRQSGFPQMQSQTRSLEDVMGTKPQGEYLFSGMDISQRAVPNTYSVDPNSVIQQVRKEWPTMTRAMNDQDIQNAILGGLPEGVSYRNGILTGNINDPLLQATLQKGGVSMQTFKPVTETSATTQWGQPQAGAYRSASMDGVAPQTFAGMYPVSAQTTPAETAADISRSVVGFPSMAEKPLQVPSQAVQQTVRENFNSAFADARSRGDATFTWTNPLTGKTSLYTTQLARKQGGRVPSMSEPDEWLAEKNESKKQERGAIAKRPVMLSSRKS